MRFLRLLAVAFASVISAWNMAYAGLIFSSLITVLLLWSGTAFSQSFQAVAHHETDGMVSNVVYNIGQDRTGCIVAMTRHGLARYDGLSWSKMPDRLKLPKNRATEIITATDGNVWIVGIQGDSIVTSIFDGKDWELLASTPVPQKDRQAQNLASAHQVLPDGKAELVVGLGRSIHRLHNNTWEHYGADQFNNAFQIIFDLCFHQNKLYLATNRGVFTLSETGQLSPVALELPDPCVVRIAPDPVGIGVYLMGVGWLARTENFGPVELVVADFPSLDIGKRVNSTLIPLSNGQVVFGANSIFKLYDPIRNSTSTLDFSGQIAALWHNSAFVDRENNIWISTDRGLAMISNLNFQYYDHSHGLPEDEVSGVLQWDANHLLVGSNFSISLVGPNRSKTIYMDRDPNRLIYRFSQFQWQGDQVYFIAYQKGVGCIDKNLNVTWVAPLPHESGINALLKTSDSLFVAGRQTLYCWDGKKYHELYATKGYIRRIMQINKKLWLVTSGGLYVREGSNWKSIKSSDPDLANVSSMISNHGTLFVGTYAGVGEVSGDSIRHAFSVENRLGRPVFDLCLDPQLHLWAGTDNGAYQLDKSGQWFNFTRANGLIGNEINRGTMHYLSNGHISIGTEKGLSIYNPFRKPPPRLQTPFPKILSVVDKSGRTIDPFESFELAAADNGLTFELGGVSMNLNKELQYRMMLEGADADWVEFSDAKKINRTYAQLSAGTYRLRFQVAHTPGAWSEELTSASFTVAGPFYTRWWFITTMGLLVLILAFSTARFFYNLRMKNMLKMQVEKQTAVIRESEQSLRKRNSELRKINEELDSFVYRVAHDLRGPLMRILGLINIYRDEEPEANQKLLGYMELSVTQTDHFIRELLDYSKNARKESTIEPIDILDLVHSQFQAYSIEAGESAIDLIIPETRAETAFHSDPLRVRILIQNLISNAIRYRTENPDKRPFVEVSTVVNKRQAVIQVRDNGIGMSQSESERIYEMFYRAHPRSTGSGLGMFIVSEAIEKLKGEISVSSEKGVGTLFTVRIPNQAPEAVAETTPSDKQSQPVVPVEG